jgi:hypothetical protein
MFGNLLPESLQFADKLFFDFLVKGYLALSV